MKTADLLLAINALDAARQALRIGNATIPEQMRIADACSKASSTLRHALEPQQEPVMWYYRRAGIRDAEDGNIHNDGILVWQIGAKRPEGKHWEPLYTGPSPQAAESVSVPREPTEAIREAMYDYWREHHYRNFEYWQDALYRIIVQAAKESP